MGKLFLAIIWIAVWLLCVVLCTVVLASIYEYLEGSGLLKILVALFFIFALPATSVIGKADASLEARFFFSALIAAVAYLVYEINF